MGKLSVAGKIGWKAMCKPLYFLSKVSQKKWPLNNWLKLDGTDDCLANCNLFWCLIVACPREKGRKCILNSKHSRRAQTGFVIDTTNGTKCDRSIAKRTCFGECPVEINQMKLKFWSWVENYKTIQIKLVFQGRNPFIILKLTTPVLVLKRVRILFN